MVTTVHNENERSGYPSFCICTVDCLISYVFVPELASITPKSMLYFVSQESESEVEGLDEVDDDVGDEHENEHEPEVPITEEPVIKKPSEAPVTKESERQLSKKELKKKELEELDAVLAEFGYAKQETGSQDDPDGKLALVYFTFVFVVFLYKFSVPTVNMWIDFSVMSYYHLIVKLFLST